MHSGDSSSSQGITVKREIRNEEPDTYWDGVESQQSHGPSPAAASSMNSAVDQSSRSQSSNPTSQMSFGVFPTTPSSVPYSTRAEHEALMSAATNSGTDGYAGYYRPCSVPHSSQSAAYLVPPVIMLPQTLPQYFVPVSQQFQVPATSRDNYMVRSDPIS